MYFFFEIMANYLLSSVKVFYPWIEVQ